VTHAAILSRIAHRDCVEAPAVKLGNRWWERLDPKFSLHPEPFQLELRDAVPVRLGATIDVALRTGGACLVGGLAMPVGYHPLRMRDAMADRSMYCPMADSGDPAKFFKPPPKHIRLRTRRARRPLFRPRDGKCLDVRFDSPYEPLSPLEARRYRRVRRNSKAHARWWRHDDGPRPTVIAIHGFSADFYHLNEWFFALPWLYSRGFDVILFTLPFHGKRQGCLSPFSGYGFFSGGASRVNEAFGQAICDLRVMVDHLMEVHGAPRVGVTGVSLGGYTSALLACVDDRLSFAAPIVPLASIADLALEWQTIGTALRAAMMATGISVQEARHMIAVTSPLTYAPLLPRERLMVIGGVGDRLAPPKHSRLLWEHWDRCRLYWFPGNHLIHLDRGEYLRQLGRFLRDVGFFEGLPRKPH